jgi:thiosulfate dehydrogenase
MMKRAILTALIGLAGCSPEPALDFGRRMFDDSSVSTAGSNAFRCTTCHVVTPTAPTTKIPSGFTLYDVTQRPSYWGGFEVEFLAAMNQCVTNFMRGDPLQASDDKARGLYLYLRSVSPDATAPALPLTVVKDIVDVPSGDARVGADVYRAACANCHGAPHTGAGRINAQQTIIPDDTLVTFADVARAVVIEKARHGKFFNIGGNMPLFPIEALSDEQLGQILGYLEGFGLPRSP